MNQAIAILDKNDGPWRRVRRWLIMAPHPDDFDAVAVTLRRIADWGAEMFLDVLTTGASGVDNAFAPTWEQKVAVREAEQQEACQLFGLPEDHLRFHRLAEDKEGHMREDLENETRVRAILDRASPAGVVLPHGNDTNADHQRTYRIFDRWARGRARSVSGLLIRDPKTVAMRLDVVTPFHETEANWKARILRLHQSQQQRNLSSRGCGFDERILRVNREIAKEAGLAAPFAEGFEVVDYS